MGRYYRFSKKISKDESKKVIEKMKNLDNLEKIMIAEDQTHLLVETKNNDYTEIMGKAVNICKVTAGIELSFERFITNNNDKTGCESLS